MRLVVFHYHDRPGGVRQVITRGLPPLVERCGNVGEVVLLLGEQTDPAWARELAASLNGLPLRCVVHPDFGYLSGREQVLGRDAGKLLDRVLSGRAGLCWAHNLSVGRNIPLLRMLPDRCAAAGVRLWLHHHDWWWDGRWARWADWQAAGVDGLGQALGCSVPTGPHLRHWCVNGEDLNWLQQAAGGAAQWVGNPLPDPVLPDKNEIRQAAAWLREKAGGRRVWLAPVRALRRKNLAEALLLVQQQRSLGEKVCLVTTGGPSSPAEVPAWHTFCQTAARHHWPLVPGVLAASSGTRSGGPGPRVAALIAVSDAIIMTSLQEGFGLPYLEAAFLNKPLLARALPGVQANLAALGCTLPGAYSFLPVERDPCPGAGGKALPPEAPGQWLRLLPAELTAGWEETGGSPWVDFGQLPLTAQLDVMARGSRPAGALPQPGVPGWPHACRIDHWADRFFQTPDPPAAASGSSLLPEVRRRFQYWLRHPLLWP